MQNSIRENSCQGNIHNRRETGVRWPAWLAYIFLFYFMCLPVTQNLLKAFMIGLMLALICLKFLIFGRAVRLSRALSAWTLFYVALGFCYILYGLVLGAPGALFSSLVYIIYPIIYMVFVAATTEAGLWTKLLKIVPVATIAIGLATADYALWTLGVIPNWLYIDFGMIESANFSMSFVQMSHRSLASLIFLVPFLMASLVMYGDRQTPFGSRKVLWTALLLGIAVALLGGRRALTILLVIAPFLIWLFRTQLPSELKRSSRRRMAAAALVSAVVILSAGLLLFGVLNSEWHGVADLLAGGFDFESNVNAQSRSDQFFPLINGWVTHPIFGNGLGSYTPESIRTDRGRVWEYELQYALLLFQTGIAGTLLYASGVLWLYWQALKIIRSGSERGRYIIPPLVGTTCILIANNVDPYLQTFGHLWMLFITIGLINWYSTTRSGTKFQAVSGYLPEPALG